ncbi:mitochondrial outer membrane protein porin 2 [Ricinus communis]|uniref:Voltage-dependent anion-selective channel, putative n=1 Tax=Ricinus communis TaxID=3988 RepID=B9R705_RICCO|nr:mitochondrial outer membrane protein porin 2 [Ricinus communis]EEF52285.1 voltage-dependent anion-selective channel, putative [Ricinus communis]|eukprot:XP_002510098.1 mitochondrial outer membrane protein porin 2 [Ricinus communis]
MSKGPGLFSDFGKKAGDLLNKDYSTDHKIAVSSSFASGGITSSLYTKGGLSSGDVATQLKFKNGSLDIKINTESNILATLTATELPSSTKVIASVKLPDYNSGKLEVQYFHEHAGITAAAGLNHSPVVDVSATIGTPTIAFGAETSYTTATGEFPKYNAGVRYSTADSNASVILADKGDSIQVSYLHHLDLLNKGTFGGMISRKFSTNENTLTVACSYVVDPQTVLKAKLNNHGNLGALLQHEINPKSLLTLSGSFDTKNLQKNPKFGLALSLKP